MAQVRIGCSGWSYKHWRGSFYPDRLPQREHFGFYAERYDTAELNTSFYHLPKEESVKGWAAKAPPGFLFAWKASRFITHNKKLKDCAESVALVFERMSHLGEHEGPVLFQLPPNLHFNAERLDGFLTLLPRDRRSVFEFRDPSWYIEETYEVLRAHNAAFCISDHHKAPAPWVVTSDLVYVRGHGPGGLYWGDYGEDELGRWAAAIRRWQDEGREVFAYFDNDIGTAAPRDADRLKAMLAQAPA